MPTSRFSVQETYRPTHRDLLLLPFCDGKKACFERERLPAALRGVKPPEGEGGSATVFAGRLGGKEVLARAVRLDAESSSVAEELKSAVAEALRLAEREKLARVALLLDGCGEECLLAAREGAELGGYVFDKYLEKRKSPLSVVAVARRSGAALREAGAIFSCVNFARDVLNEPPCAVNPPTLAREFARAARGTGLKVTVWDEKRLARERCGGILAVGGGSAHRPRLVIGEYRPRGAKRHLCLVGKGVTFDTGGYCLKPGAGQLGMKLDMGGAAMMFGAALALAKLRAKLRLTVLTPLVQNDISAGAYHVQDILRTRSGKTVEVGNTDAEGRLILADALALAGEREPDYIIDAATLTGACVVALGEGIAGAFGNDPELTLGVIAAGARAGECFWELPLHRPYLKQLRSDIADTSNMGGKWGGAINAALFLSQWVAKKTKWLHLDIAGPGMDCEQSGQFGKGARGFGVKTMVEFARSLE